MALTPAVTMNSIPCNAHDFEALNGPIAELSANRPHAGAIERFGIPGALHYDTNTQVFFHAQPQRRSSRSHFFFFQLGLQSWCSACRPFKAYTNSVCVAVGPASR